MLKRKTHKKLFSLMMVFAMIFSCFSNGMMKTSANTTNTSTTSQQQIINTGGETSKPADNVKVSKTIVGTDTENVFDITLQVETKENLEEIHSSPDAATILVLDVSGSMEKKANGKKPAKNEKSKFEQMQVSAIEFINNYAKVEVNSDGTKASRWIAIMSFSSDAKRELEWIDVAASEANLEKATDAIDNLEDPDGGTNIEGGLQLAYNNLNGFTNQTSKSVPSNSSVILLTDGCPTFHIGSSTSKSSLDSIKGTRGGGTNAYRSDWNPIGGKVGTEDLTESQNTLSNKIKAKAQLYTIAFATNESKFSYLQKAEKWWPFDETKEISINPHDWMKTFANRALMAGNEKELLSEFDKINQIIKLSAQAWQVTDPMGNYIDFQGIDKDFDKANVTSIKGNTLTWDVKFSDATTKTVNGQTTYTYTLKYRVALDTTKEGIDYSKVATNGTTTLKYFLSKEVGTATPETLLKTLDFKVPEVKGLFGSLDFTKTDENNKGMKGVTFTLEGTTTGSNKSITRTVVSDKDGIVSMTGIPAGTYKLTEKAPDGYKAVEPKTVVVSYGKTTVDGGTLTNVKNYPVNRSLTISKNWAGLTAEQLKNIPDEIEVNILQNGTEYKTIKLNKVNKWTVTMDVPWGDNNNNSYAYSVKESALVNGYTSAISGDQDKGFVITNTYAPEKLTLDGTKTWVAPEGTNEYPDIKVTLQRSLDGKTWEDVQTQTLVSPNLKYTFENVEKTAPSGVNYKFRVQEADVNGYTPTYSDDLNITNTYTPKDISVAVKKVWSGVASADQLPVITVQLLQNNVVKDTITLNKDTGWSHTFDKLPDYAPNGKLYEYTVKEVMPEGTTGYTTAITGDSTEGYVITNTLKTDETRVDVEKIWQGVPDGTVKPTITLRLLQDGQEFRIARLENGTTSATFDNLPKYSSLGKEYVYTVSEDTIAGFTTSMASSANKVTFTNEYTGELKDIEGTKTWNNVPENTKVPDVTIKLQQKIAGQADSEYKDINSVVLKNGKTDFTFKNVPTIAPTGDQYEYRLVEDKVNGYETNITGNQVTNTYTPGKTSLSVEKVWKGIVPNADGSNVPTVQVQLYKNGAKDGSPVTLTKADDYKYTYSELLKYAPDGTEYTYTVKEIFNGGDAYSSTVSGGIITNTFDNSKINIDVEKVWSNIPENTVVPNITVNLLKDKQLVDTVELTKTKTTHTFTGLEKYDSADGHKYEYTVEEVSVDGYSSTITGSVDEGFTITNTYDGGEKTSITGKKVWSAPEGTTFPGTTIYLQSSTDGNTWVDVEGKVITIAASTNAEESFEIDNLPSIAPDGSTYQYRFIEKTVPNGYKMTQAGNTITNTYDSAITSLIIHKEWVNVDSTSNELPEVKVQVMQEIAGKPETRKDFLDTPIVIDQTGETAWTRTVGNLPIYAPSGERYVYTVREILPDGTVGYESRVEQTVTNGNEYTIINTFSLTKIDVTVNKTWEGVTNTDTVPTITVNLLRDGELHKTQEIVAGESSTTFNNLAKFSIKGKEYVYTIEEVPVAGYETAVDGYNITNTYTGGEKVNVEGTKTWSNPDETHPTITVNLLQNGVEIDERVLANGETEYTFTNLPSVAPDGTEYTYTVTEDAVAGYETAVDGYNITNTYTGGEAVNVEGTKTWSNPDETHPTITVNLLQNGVEIDERVLANGETEYTFTNLPSVAPDGTRYTYTVTEDAVAGYETAVDGYNITNTYTGGEAVNVEGTKTWSNPDETHPTITVNLLQNGVEIDEVILENGTLSYVFTNLPSVAPDGTRYTYTVTEDAVAGYETAVDGYNITNTYTGGETINISGTKTWENIEDGEIVPTITLRLVRDGVEIDQVILENGTLSYQFTNLPTVAPDGHVYEYDVTEDAVDGFESVKNGFDFTNIREDDVLGDDEEPVLPVIPPLDEDEVLGDVEDPINTGDHTGMELYGFLSLIAVAGMTVLKRRKES